MTRPDYDTEIIGTALGYFAEERLTDLCNYFGVTSTEAAAMRLRAEDTLARLLAERPL